jgi:quinol monooxygenase YgiN
MTWAGSALLAGLILLGGPTMVGQAAKDGRGRVVRLAELEIDSGQLNEYTAALREQIEASIRVEPGVLALYAVSVKDHPDQIRLFEMYADTAAYEAHLESPHFKKYKAATAGMVKSLKLIETEPLLLGVK